MKVTRYNPTRDEPVTLELDITELEMVRYQSGTVLSVAAPRLTSGERIWIQTGVMWDEFRKDLPRDATPQEVRNRVVTETPTYYFPESM